MIYYSHKGYVMRVNRQFSVLQLHLSCRQYKSYPFLSATRLGTDEMGSGGQKCSWLSLTLSRRPKTVTCPRACSFLCLHSTRLRPLSMGRVTFLLPTVGLTVPASRCGSVCRATSMPLASISLREPSAPM